MEVPGGRENKFTVCLYEFIGTSILLISINMSLNTAGGSFQPVAIGFTIFMNICFLGGISGGHFNPAVTLAVLVREGTQKIVENLTFALMIIASQLLGASAGVTMVYLMLKKDPTDQTIFPKIALLCPSYDADRTDNKFCEGTGFYLQVILIEVIVTFVFINVILSVKYHAGAQDHILNGLIIGTALFGMITVSAGTSGGCLNPAVGLVQQIF